ncbi:MAG: acyl-CoA thioesterase [Pseudomonadota bacterium]
MNLFFRLFRTILWDLIGRKSIGYLDKSTLKFRVWITDQDAFQHMNNARYMSITDLSVIDLIIRTGVGAPMRKKGIIPVIVYKNCTYHRMLKFPQTYEVQSRFAAWDGPYVFFEHLFIRKGKLVSESISVGRLVGRKGEKPTVQEAIELLGWEDVPESPPLTDEQRRVLDKILAARAEDKAQVSG